MAPSQALCNTAFNSESGLFCIWRIGVISNQWQGRPFTSNPLLPSSITCSYTKAISGFWPHPHTQQSWITMDRVPSVWGVSSTPSSGPAHLPFCLSPSWWFISPSPTQGHPCLLWALRNLPRPGGQSMSCFKSQEPDAGSIPLAEL